MWKLMPTKHLPNSLLDLPPPNHEGKRGGSQELFVVSFLALLLLVLARYVVL
jgi:hypothetical protein